MDFNYSFDYSSAMGDELGAVMAGAYTVYQVIGFLIGVAGYVLHSLGVYTIAKRRGLDHPWMAWIPVLNVWILGSISDQFRYVTKAQVRNKRKTLVILEAVMLVLLIALLAAIGVKLVDMMPAMMEAPEEMIMAEALSLVLWLVLGLLGIGGVAIAFTIIYYMAMYDVYTSVNPSCSVVFLVLSIFFNFLEPWFIFFNRKKDLGMPPRCDIPTAPVQPVQLPPQEPWENAAE